MKKKKGFTLIELIAAIAILGIALSGVTVALLAGVHIEKKSDVKLETSTYGKALVENIKVQSDFTLQQMQNIKYIYFDDKKGFEACMKNLIFNAEVEIDPTKTGKDIIFINSNEIANCTFANCKGENEKQNKRKYGACIRLVEVKDKCRFEVQVWLWSFQQGEGSLTKREFYIRR